MAAAWSIVEIEIEVRVYWFKAGIKRSEVVKLVSVGYGNFEISGFWKKISQNVMELIFFTYKLNFMC